MKPLPCLVFASLLFSGNGFADAASTTEQEAPPPSTSISQESAAASQPVGVGALRKGNANSLTAVKNPVLKKPVALGEGSSLLPQLFQVALGLLFVLAMIIGTAWLFRRFGQAQYTVKGNFRVLGGVHLSTREKVVLLQLGQQQLLLGVAPGRVNILHVLEQPLDLNSATPVSESAFAKRLASLIQGKQP